MYSCVYFQSKLYTFSISNAFLLNNTSFLQISVFKILQITSSNCRTNFLSCIDTSVSRVLRLSISISIDICPLNAFYLFLILLPCNDGINSCITFFLDKFNLHLEQIQIVSENAYHNLFLLGSSFLLPYLGHYSLISTKFIHY